jgi:hypothetical protein
VAAIVRGFFVYYPGHWQRSACAPLLHDPRACPSPFLSRKFPPVSIIRGTSIFGAVATIKAFTADGLFIGQTDGFFDLVGRLRICEVLAYRDTPIALSRTSWTLP